MATRTEKVVLTADVGGFTSAVARAHAETAVLDRRLEALDGSSIKAKTSLRDAEKGVDSFGKSAKRSSADLDSFSVRLGLLGSAAAAIGPSIVPVFAAAVPAIGALSTGMVGATAAAGTLLLAFNGVGDAISAVSDYQLEPTADNLAKVKAAFDEIGPSGARFVLALKEMQPVLDDLQQASRDGIFPGFERGLDELVSKAPGIISFVEDISARVGDLGGDLGSALANDADLQEFFSFIDSEAGPAMEDFGRATGNFIAGILNMIEALSGLSGGVSGDLLEMSRSFREWAAGMEDTEGFREFADYIRTTGPQVADFLGALGEALVALTTAVAPWGAVVLPVLTAAAKAFAALAESPIGPPLFAAAAAMLAFNKASALMGPSLTKASTSVRTLGADLRLLSTGLTTFSWERSATQAAAFGAAAERTKGRLASLRKEAAAAGPGIAAFAALSTGAADKVGLSNTAMLTMAGSMAGPWGTAIGAGVGLTMDLAAANDDLKSALDGASQAMSGGSLDAITKQMAALRKEYDAINTSDSSTFGERIGEIFSIDANMAAITGEGKKAAAALKELESQKSGLEGLAVALGANKDSATEMASGVDRAQVAMDALGISNEALGLAFAAGGVEFDILSGRIQEYVANSESVAGRTANVGAAMAALGGDALGTAAAADQLNAALNDLFGPTLNLEAATDQWRASLKTLRDELNADAGFSSFTEAGRKNNELTRQYVNDSVDRLTQLAGATTTTEADMAKAVQQTRNEFIQSGIAAGFSRKEITARADAMGLTPDLVETIFRNLGITEADLKARELKRSYDKLPKEVRSDIKANGIPKSEADITRLTKKYHLTPDQVRTLALLKDNASGPIAAILRELLNLDGRSATTTVRHRTINEIITISSGQQTRPDRRVLPGQTSADGSFQENGVRAFADGGYGMDGRYYSRQPMLVSGGKNILWGEKETGWEAYISGKPSERDRNLQILGMAADRLGASVTAFASGGMAGGRPTVRRTDLVAAALWQSGHRDPTASLIAGMTVRQLARLGRSFDDLSSKRLTRFGRGLERASDIQEKQTEAARTRFEKVRDRRNELSSGIADGLRGDLWSDTGGSAFGKQFASGSIGAVNAQLRSERDQAKQFIKDIAILRDKGINGAALQEIIAEGDYARARTFASGSTSALRSYEAAFNARQSATAAAGRLGGQVLTPEFNALRAAYNRQVAEQKATNRQLAALRKEQGQRHDAAQKSRKDNGAGPAAKRGARGR
ncbi:hypothetical protein ACIRON_02685 [Nocardioides sp. NPDC101246]|uniref:hypothetical protein n=1 Tax=Nocardioides sp. NPDC101246 TaxID=3364336 RepID=UPI00381789FD